MTDKELAEKEYPYPAEEVFGDYEFELADAQRAAFVKGLNWRGGMQWKLWIASKKLIRFMEHWDNPTTEDEKAIIDQIIEFREVFNSVSAKNAHTESEEEDPIDMAENSGPDREPNWHRKPESGLQYAGKEWECRACGTMNYNPKQERGD